MTPVQFKSARRALGLSAAKMAQALGVASGRTIRRWEAGESGIPGPTALAMWFLLIEARIEPEFDRP